MTDNVVTLFQKPNEDIKKAFLEVIVPDIVEKLENGSFEALCLVCSYTDTDGQTVASESILTVEWVDFLKLIGAIESVKFQVSMNSYVSHLSQDNDE